MEKSIKVKANARLILSRYLANKNLDELKTLFSVYQAQATAEIDTKVSSKASVAKGFASFNLLPQGSTNRYLNGVELDDQHALRSDWLVVGEDLSAAWLQTQVKEAV